MTLGTSETLFAAVKHLSETIDARATADPETSYTAKLLQDGPGKCAKKLGEEGVELALAIASEDAQNVSAEAADLIYHLLVGLRSREVSLDAVAEALIKRQGMSGLDEKAGRTS